MERHYILQTEEPSNPVFYMGKVYRDKKNLLMACPASGHWGMRRQPPIAAEKTCCERYPGRFVAYRGQKVAKNTLGKPTERRADFLPPYASQIQLAVMISCRTFMACDLDNEEWRPLVGMLCFGKPAKIRVKSHSSKSICLKFVVKW
jgi:hypothetical protein